MAVACGSLLGAAPVRAVAAEDVESKKWFFDTGLHYYDESDRVTDVSLSGQARRLWINGKSLILRLTVDTLTGASASGAAPATAPQTFTTPSAAASYQTVAGETPLDPTFLDTRVAVSANFIRPIGRNQRIDVGLSASNEYDYLHLGANASWMRDFNDRNTTLTIGTSIAADSVDPVGGAPVPLADMLPAGDLSNKLGDDDKTIADLLVGVTQVFGKRTIGQFNYSFSRASGYLTDPYKILSVVDPITGDPAPGPGGLNRFVFESRPEDRTKHGLYAGMKRAVAARGVLDVSYRFATDDWNVDSHTLDLRYRFGLGAGYLQPHVRYYMQSEAEFYSRVLFDGAPLPRFATADYRLGDLDSFTVGAKYGRPLSKGREWSLRLEYYRQSGSVPGDVRVGSLAGADLFPDVEASIVQAGFRF
ncbi:MAG: DUF3570 domain-containing protein [Planctomycetota bacterium]|nr:DUF3570 domain-containing protein [Planctomycetota bacterium]